MTRPVRLKEVQESRRSAEAREIRAALFQRCRAAIEQCGEDIAGFALVVWNKEGEMRSAYDTTRGPIRAPLVPTLVSDALNRHVAVMLAAAREAEGGS